MSKTLSIEEIEHVPWRDIIDDAKASGEVVVQDASGQGVVVVPIEEYAKLKGTSMDEAMAKLRKEWDEELAVLKEPGTSERLIEIFHMTPEEMAAAANAAERRRG